MAPKPKLIADLLKKLRLDIHPVAVYDTKPSDAFAPLIEAKGRACCFAYFDQLKSGYTLVIRKGSGSFSDPKNGCPGAQNAFGLGDGYPPFMAHFLTDGKGAPMGEGLKATPELAQDFLDRALKPHLSGDTILIGPLKIEQWDFVRSISFFADPDRISALMTLSAYWSSDPDFIHAPFSSGCGLMFRDLENQDRKRAVLGCTDIAMRKYVPPEIMCITVSPKHFETMVNVPDDAFLNKSWWNDLMDFREKQR